MGDTLQASCSRQVTKKNVQNHLPNIPNPLCPRPLYLCSTKSVRKKVKPKSFSNDLPEITRAPRASDAKGWRCCDCWKRSKAKSNKDSWKVFDLWGRGKDQSCHGMAWIRICKSRIGTVPHNKNGREARVRQKGGINTGTMVAQERAPNLIKRGLG